MKKIKPLVERFSAQYWKSQLTLAEDRRKKFIESAEESIRVYNAQKDIKLFNDTQRRLNVWWYCVNTLLPAYYSSTPKAEVTLRKRSGGVLHEVSATLLERNVQYEMDMCFNFDEVGYSAALQFLLTGQAVLWARYTFKLEKEKEEMGLILLPDGSLIDGEGASWEGDRNTLTQGPGNTFIASVEVEKKDDEKALLEIVQYNDYYCSDARNEAEIEWQARRAFLTRNQAESLFGQDIADDLSYDSFPEAMRKDYNRDREKYEGKAEVYEIWCEEANKVFWLHKGSEKTLIQSGPPPIEFEKFYPCVVIRQSQDPDSIIPVSDFAHVKDQILEVERLTTRIHAVTQAIRTNFAYDASMGTIVEQILEGDLKGLPVPNWPSYKGRGGMANGMEFAPIEPFVNALQTLQGTRQAALQQLYETLKVSDLLRGTSEQYKTATANRLENAWSSLGLIVRQNMFTKFMSDAIANLGTIIAAQFEPEKIMSVGDADQLLTPLLPDMPQGEDPSQPPVDPAMLLESMKQQVIELLRDDDSLNYRIQIASDSMVAIDQAQDQNEGAQLMQTAGQFFEQMKNMIEQYPPLLEFSIALFQNFIKRFKGGKELDGIFTKALQQVGEIAKAKEEAAKQPPPPDPKMLEMQGRMQIAQVESQARLQATQMEMQDKAVKNQLAYQDQQLKMQRDQLESQLRVQEQQFKEYMEQQRLAIDQQEVQVKAQAVQVDMLKVQSSAQTEADKNLIKQETQQMAHILEIQRLELENMRIKLSESEKLMEERRLASEQALERVRLQMEQVNTPKLMSMGGMTGRKKSGKIITDDNGNPTAIEITEQPEVKVQRITLDEEGNPSGIELE
jgi:hypothetical protein